MPGGDTRPTQGEQDTTELGVGTDPERRQASRLIELDSRFNGRETLARWTGDLVAGHPPARQEPRETSGLRLDLIMHESGSREPRQFRHRTRCPPHLPYGEGPNQRDRTRRSPSPSTSNPSRAVLVGSSARAPLQWTRSRWSPRRAPTAARWPGREEDEPALRAASQPASRDRWPSGQSLPEPGQPEGFEGETQGSCAGAEVETPRTPANPTRGRKP